MKRYIVAILVILTAGVFSSAYAETIDVFNATTIANLIRDRVAKVNTFTGTFTYRIDNRNMNGEIHYKAPNKFSMDYENKNRIVSDGRNLWLFFESHNIAVREGLDRDTSTPMVGWNIKRLMREYVPVLPRDGNYRVSYANAPAYRVFFSPRSNTAGFRSIEMIVSEDGLIRRINAVNQLGKTIQLSINYSTINNPIRDEVFMFEIDEETQVYENILIPSQS
jgi:outer membrane lipoprotein-sorting protein